MQTAELRLHQSISHFLLVFFSIWIFSCSSPKKETQDNSGANVDEPSEVIQSDNFEDILTKAPGILELKLIEAGLIDVQTLAADILIDMKYATEDNFVNTIVYDDLHNCYLQPDVAQKLAKAFQYLKEERPDLTLLVYDCARPLSVQQIFWDLVDVPENQKHNYVARPSQGSIHNYGCAVDLTLADTLGNALDMGTEFDYFGEEAHTDKEDEWIKKGMLTVDQVKNRKLLRKIMIKAGFTPINYEWWHFNATSRETAKEKYALIE
ncbi:MAG: M15 family metallopeptidase [Cyclobacteriaceae bacterium]